MTYPWQKSQWQQISQLLETDRLPHALLFHGNQGLGKADFANALAGAVLCNQPTEHHQACGTCSACNLLAAKTHPDMYYLEPTTSGKSKSANPVVNIRIDDIRQLCGKLNQTSQFSGYRVAILNQADKLTISAANSLLKTLEEPGDKVLLILVTAQTYRLPITIRSRCQSIRFNMPDEQISLEWLLSHVATMENGTTYTAQQIQHALKLAYGSPLATIGYLNDEEYQQVLSDALTAKISGKNSLDFATKLSKFPKVKSLEALLSWTSDLTKLTTCRAECEIVNEQHRSTLQRLAKTVNSQRLFRFHDQLNFNILHSAIAVNEQLLWESLLLSWDNI